MINRIISALCRLFISLTIAGVVGLFVYALLAPFAFAERGYFALGGEFMLAAMVACFGTCFLFFNSERLLTWVRNQLQYSDERKRINHNYQKRIK